MGPVSYFIAILGCADGSAACQPVATTATRYENVAQCEANRDAGLDANMDLDFPTLIAECRISGATSASAPAEDRQVKLAAKA